MKQMLMVIAVTAGAAFVGCGVQDEPIAMDEPTASTEQELTSSCLSMYVRRCDGSQFSRQDQAKAYCDRYCTNRGYPACSHLYVSCGSGVGVTCRCRVPFGGVN